MLRPVCPGHAAQVSCALVAPQEEDDHVEGSSKSSSYRVSGASVASYPSYRIGRNGPRKCSGSSGVNHFHRSVVLGKARKYRGKVHTTVEAKSNFRLSELSPDEPEIAHDEVGGSLDSLASLGYPLAELLHLQLRLSVG